MFVRRKSSTCSDGGGGDGGGGSSSIPPCRPPYRMHTSNKLFGNNNRKRLVVQRAPLMSGLNVKLQKKFQRPMLKRRAYGKSADLALKQASLGQRKRMDGFNRLMARSGKPLMYKATSREKKVNSDGETEESDSEDEKEEDRPFEPLKLWTSPHQEEGVEPIGLPPQMYVCSYLLVAVASGGRYSRTWCVAYGFVLLTNSILTLFSFHFTYIHQCHRNPSR